MTSARLLTILLALTYWPAAVFAASATEVLKRAEVAGRYVSYRGVKTATVYSGGYSTTATLKVVHLKPDKTRTQYFAPPVLSGVILIQDGSDLWKYYPRTNAWEEVRSRPGSQDTISQRALENYDVRLVGTDRVAGRPVYVVQAMPRSRGDSARRLWVDREHYLVVGTQVESPGGAVVNSSRYTQVEFNPDDISPSSFKVSGKLVRDQKPCGPARFRVTKPAYVPSGYALVGVSYLNVNGCPSSHMQFSNGVSTLSLFQHPCRKNTPAQNVKSKLTNVLTWARSGMQFTLMGDLSRAELQKIADSVR